MMNLEVLFVSAALTGNHTLIDIANSHATTTMNNHIRSDGSTWHVIEYDSTNGRVTKKRTAQGYSDSSTWTRGQAWGVYGFAMSEQPPSNSIIGLLNPSSVSAYPEPGLSQDFPKTRRILLEQYARR